MLVFVLHIFKKHVVVVSTPKYLPKVATNSPSIKPPRRNNKIATREVCNMGEYEQNPPQDEIVGDEFDGEGVDLDEDFFPSPLPKMRGLVIVQKRKTLQLQPR